MDETRKIIVTGLLRTAGIITIAAGLIFLGSYHERKKSPPKPTYNGPIEFTSTITELLPDDKPAKPGEAYRMTFANGMCGYRSEAFYTDSSIYLHLEQAQLRDAQIFKEPITIRGTGMGECVSIESLLLQERDITKRD